MRGLRRLLGVTALLVVVGLGWIVWAHTGDRPFDLGEPPGPLTGRELVALGRKPDECRALLDRAGIRYARLEPRLEGAACGWGDGMKLTDGGALGITLVPDAPPLTCPVAAGLAMWEWSIVQPAAQRYLGTSVVGFDQLGTYNCRRIAGSASWSEHATANAIDIAGFRLADGRRLTILADWPGKGPEAMFLRQVRTGACKVYATVLSPDYNAAHRDHLHLDQAARGATGWRVCH
ncbi:extensin family protein [Sphingomonas sp.]|uniref:extensin-like domain-containing protein n=1 Tax=Sphingomonas sp. TaxID=28214 RepID=UPI003AFFAFA9